MIGQVCCHLKAEAIPFKTMVFKKLHLVTLTESMNVVTGTSLSAGCTHIVVISVFAPECKAIIRFAACGVDSISMHGVSNTAAKGVPHIIGKFDQIVAVQFAPGILRDGLQSLAAVTAGFNAVQRWLPARVCTTTVVSNPVVESAEALALAIE